MIGLLQAFLIYPNWAGSLLFGWLQEPLWLVVPLLTWSLFAFGVTARIQKQQKATGVAASTYNRRMLVPNLILVLRNTAINCVLFALAYAGALSLG
ncbi:MAG TPA: hypothetical protein VJ798_13160 [Rhizomicrobium sp.]|nr:hypothetical protein [Rhizomicrobium sp.]